MPVVFTGLLVLFLLCAWGMTQIQGFKPQAPFDVPKLVGKDITSVREDLGEPTYFVGRGMSSPFTDQTWERDGVLLRVTASRKLGTVREFTVCAVDDHETLDGVEALKVLTGLREDDPHYKIALIRGSDALLYHGIQITPAERPRAK